MASDSNNEETSVGATFLGVPEFGFDWSLSDTQDITNNIKSGRKFNIESVAETILRYDPTVKSLQSMIMKSQELRNRMKTTDVISVGHGILVKKEVNSTEINSTELNWKRFTQAAALALCMTVDYNGIDKLTVSEKSVLSPLAAAHGFVLPQDCTLEQFFIYWLHGPPAQACFSVKLTRMASVFSMLFMEHFWKHKDINYAKDPAPEFARLKYSDKDGEVKTFADYLATHTPEKIFGLWPGIQMIEPVGGVGKRAQKKAITLMGRASSYLTTLKQQTASTNVRTMGNITEDTEEVLQTEETSSGNRTVEPRLRVLSGCIDPRGSFLDFSEVVYCTATNGVVEATEAKEIFEGVVQGERDSIIACNNRRMGFYREENKGACQRMAPTNKASSV